MREKLQAEMEKIEKEIEDLKKRWPAHSVKPSMVQKMEELEDRLLELKQMNK